MSGPGNRTNYGATRGTGNWSGPTSTGRSSLGGRRLSVLVDLPGHLTRRPAAGQVHHSKALPQPDLAKGEREEHIARQRIRLLTT